MVSEIVPTVDGSLRDRQRALTRGLIVDALAQVILRDGISEFSMQAVAAGARCSLRTLYRYFPSREALLVGLEEEMADFARLSFERMPVAGDDLVTFAERMPLLLDERRDLVRAWAAAVPASRVRESVSARMSELVGASVDRAAPSLSTARRFRAVAALRLVANSRSWLTLTDQLTAQDAADVMAWMVRTLLADLSNGGGPNTNDSRNTKE